MATAPPKTNIVEDQVLEQTRYVGTLVGESTCREFRLAVARETIREQDIVAVDAELRRPEERPDEVERIRIWAKVQRIERINPLFPTEAGQELAETRTNPFDTVLSLSREMVTAVCQVLGTEPLDGSPGGKLGHLRYPPRPASSAYRPDSKDIARIVLGELQSKKDRALDIATLANRSDVNVSVDGHVLVTRHLAILAMTGAGKSWTSRRIIEQLAAKNYPIVIFDPRGDYTGLADIPSLKGRVRRFYAQFPVFNEPAEQVMKVIESLSWEMANNQRSSFDEIFTAAKKFLQGTPNELAERSSWMSKYLGNENIQKFGIQPNLYFLADFTEVLVRAGRNEDTQAFAVISNWTDQQIELSKKQAAWIEGLIARLRTSAKALRLMEGISKNIAGDATPLPQNRTELVEHGGLSIIVLAGYTGDFQVTLYSLIAEELFNARVNGALKLPVLLVLEEGHNFVPARANTSAEERAITVTRQIAQEGRKFGVGLVLISQRPSRLDETALSQCNSYVIMRMVNPADQAFVRKVIETLGEDDARMLPDLDRGEAILSGQFINFPVLVKVKWPESKGEREEDDAFVQLEKARQELSGKRPRA